MSPLPRWTGRHSRRRRRIQLGFLLVFVLLPLFDLFRFDFPGSKLFVFRQEIGLSEWSLLWLALMFAMWVIGAVSLVFGRVYCAYACPQMVFSELAHDIESLSLRLTRKVLPVKQKRAAQALAWSAIGAGSVLVAALAMGYFAPLPLVWSKIHELSVGPWIGLVGVALTVLIFLDLAFVRERFCRSVCPYGLLQGVIEDGRSLHVAFDESTGPCINCRGCTHACPMEIDIRKGAFQIECTRCGACVDACESVLKKRDRPSLLAFDFGGIAHGGWDVKRVLVTLATVGFGVVFAVAVARRQAVTFEISPVYQTTAASARSAELAEARYLLRAANHGKHGLRLQVSVEGLPSAEIAGLEDPALPAGGERRITLIVRVPRGSVTGSVTPFTWVLGAGDQQQRIAATFYTGGKTAS
ncbi:MAG: 4Fe-4S binding protein [Acidobacteria bacterium]|nr:4Fe-4S binding protein [Acidobacteriota bacterium]